MSLLTILLLAVALGTDAFSMCLGIGMAGVKPRQIALISITIFVFHIIMPLTGWFFGSMAGGIAGRAAAIAGSLILIYLGARMLWDVHKCNLEQSRVALVNGWGLLLLSASVSMDALSVGFTLGALNTNLIPVTLIFGVVAGLMTVAGLLLGNVLGRCIGGRAQTLGGLILIGIGIKLFF